MRRTGLVLSLVAAAGCSTLLMDPLEQLRAQNKKNLERVAVGHTRLEVESIMGQDRAGGGLPEIAFGRVQYLQARNPMRGNDGSAYKLLFYYTDLRTKDDKITDDELTPIVFRDGRVIGVGYAFLGERVPAYQGVPK